MRALVHSAAFAAMAVPVQAHPAIDAFATHCFSPFLTAETAAARLGVPGARVDFYDLDPFSNVPPSPGGDVAPGTDRRCAVAFDGDFAIQARMAVLDALVREGITQGAPLPARYMTTDTTALMAARYLNPNRIAVVIVGTRPGPNGTETHMTVERLTPRKT